MNPQLAKLQQLVRDGRRVSKGRIGLPRSASLERMQHIHVVPHTHWDREWWTTVEGYRPKLISLVESLLDLLEQDPAFTSFTFDGQVAPIDDYLATLPESKRLHAEQRIRKLVAGRRLSIGPWYTLSDQYLVSGETTLRNLQLGMKRASELGGYLDIAYCPDQFGLIQELPKILNFVGLHKVIGERGMKRNLPSRFLWTTKDGSTAEMLNLKDGYFQSRISVNALRALARKSHGMPSVFMAGFDHSLPDSSLPMTVKEAGARMSSLAEFWKDLSRTSPNVTYSGEIRSIGDKALLPNVISNRVDQRHEVAHAERRLERYAEPLAASILQEYPATLLRECWQNQILNAAHDSACATGIDDVTRAVRVRAQHVRDTVDGIVSTALSTLGSSMSKRGEYVWNPSNFARSITLRKNGIWYGAEDVPALGWARLAPRPLAHQHGTDIPPLRCTDEPDTGDTYTFNPSGEPSVIEPPVSIKSFPHEPFSRLNVKIMNTTMDHRMRLMIQLPKRPDCILADTPFGHVERPAIISDIQGRDRLNGFPAGKFIVAGGYAIFLDRVTEYEYLPESNEIALTVLRSHGALSRTNPTYRLGPAGPRIPTHDTQMLGPTEWEIGVMPWNDETTLPWKEAEMFSLPMERFTSHGGGSLPSSGTPFTNVPSGILSAVLPTGIRTFAITQDHAIAMHPLELERGFPLQQGRSITSACQQIT
ncbi:MAG: hypothetical protein ACP5OR_04140 [Candidatus Dormibacteria bacterium]